MRRISLIFILIGLVFPVLGQLSPIKSVGDTIGPWSVISFEDPTDYIEIVPSMDNIWQIGHPQKTIFSQSYTVPNAIVTDTLNVYPPANQSSFVLKIGFFNSSWYPWNIFVDFRHKFNTDTLTDGGWISVSWDKGATWSNIVKDTTSLSFYYGTPTRILPGFFGNSGIYDTTATLMNGEPGFSGNSNGWKHTCLAWYDIPLIKSNFYPMDTMLLKFNFISDNNQTNKEGWMIDQIRLFSIDLGGGTADRNYEQGYLKITPNPVNEMTDVFLPDYCNKFNYSLSEISGKEIKYGVSLHGKHFAIERGNLNPGIYLLKVSDEKTGRQWVGRVVIN